jgi:hypothetical protein
MVLFIQNSVRITALFYFALKKYKRLIINFFVDQIFRTFWSAWVSILHQKLTRLTHIYYNNYWTWIMEGCALYINVYYIYSFTEIVLFIQNSVRITALFYFALKKIQTSCYNWLNTRKQIFTIHELLTKEIH